MMAEGTGGEIVDFVQVMKDWRRMCKAYTTDDDSCCEGCPVVDFHEHGCGTIYEMEDGIDWERYEGQIREWAAEHPEPVYPTWMEWLADVGAIPKAISWDEPLVEAVYDAIQEHIPADIAQKLGIQPKEETP